MARPSAHRGDPHRRRLFAVTSLEIRGDFMKRLKAEFRVSGGEEEATEFCCLEIKAIGALGLPHLSKRHLRDGLWTSMKCGLLVPNPRHSALDRTSPRLPALQRTPKRPSTTKCALVT